MAITRGELRRRIAATLGDLTELTATAHGNPETFHDSIRLSGAIEKPTNRDIVFTNGPDQGVTRRVTTYDLTAGFVMFAETPNSHEIDETAEMYNFRGRGWRVEEYNNAINQALQDAWPLAKVPYGYQAGDPFDPSTRLVPINDSNLTHIANLSYLDGGGYLEAVPGAINPLGLGWTYDPTRQALDVRGGLVPGGATMWISGFRQPTPLNGDSDVTTINPEWLTVQACNILCLAAVDRDQANYNLGMVFGQQAESQKPSIRTRVPRGTVAVYP